MKVAITGATGLIGKALCIKLQVLGNEVNAIVRDAAKVNYLPNSNVFSIVPAMGEISAQIPIEAIKNVDAVVHLMGESVADRRWTKEVKLKIIESRVKATENLVESIRLLPPEMRPKVFICASATGYYGQGFLAEVTKAWEVAAQKIEELGIRLVLLRTGVVLSQQGGALPKMGPAILGSGKQWMSWIHLEDEIRFIEFALNDERVRGAFNLVAPHPVTNREFTKTHSKVLKFPFVGRVPEWVLKSVLGEMSEIVLEGQKLFPEQALKLGFKFNFPTLEEALLDLCPGRSLLDSYYSSVQFVPSKRKDVFDFFSRAENLEALTPPWLNFKIVSKSTSDVSKNTKIAYELKIHGIPVRWLTNIEQWDPEVSFVDDQIKGPYAKWNHWHGFKEVKQGTLLIDEVTYRVPAGFIGKIALGAWIRNDIKKIFNYRTKKIAEIFIPQLLVLFL